MDQTSIIALSGIIACQIKDGQYEVAKEQLDFLKGMKVSINRFDFTILLTMVNVSEIQKNDNTGIGTSASNRSEILYMSAILGRLTNQLPEQVLGLLNEAVEAHFK